MFKTFFRMVIMLLVVGLVGSGLYWFANDFRPKMIGQVLAGLAKQVPTIATTEAKVTDWQSMLTAVGSFKAVNGADLSVEASGIVDKILFKSGDEVKEGQPLLLLRTESEVARLAQLKAAADLAKITFDRDTAQLAAHATSQATVDADNANYRSAVAALDQQQAIIDQKQLKAPFSGRLGIYAVDLGQFVSAGSTIVTLQAIDPIDIDFTLPQRDYAHLSVGEMVKATVDAYPGQTFSGAIVAISSKVDAASRNINVRARLDNHEKKLVPGMYAEVSVEIGDVQHRITVPQTAIVYSSFGNSVFVVTRTKAADGQGADKITVSQHFVKTGEARGDQIAILSGLDAGAEVVATGQLKLRNGIEVKVDNTVLPTNDANPKPIDE